MLGPLSELLTAYSNEYFGWDRFFLQLLLHPLIGLRLRVLDDMKFVAGEEFDSVSGWFVLELTGLWTCRITEKLDRYLLHFWNWSCQPGCFAVHVSFSPLSIWFCYARWIGIVRAYSLAEQVEVIFLLGLWKRGKIWRTSQICCLQRTTNDVTWLSRKFGVTKVGRHADMIVLPRLKCNLR